MKPEEAKALERQLHEVINLCNVEESEIQQAAKKALMMLPKYKQIDQHIEMIHAELMHCRDYELNVQIHYHDSPFSGGFMTTMSGKTITIEVKP